MQDVCASKCKFLGQSKWDCAFCQFVLGVPSQPHPPTAKPSRAGQRSREIKKESLRRYNLQEMKIKTSGRQEPHWLKIWRISVAARQWMSAHSKPIFS